LNLEAIQARREENELQSQYSRYVESQRKLMDNLERVQDDLLEFKKIDREKKKESHFKEG